MLVRRTYLKWKEPPDDVKVLERIIKLIFHTHAFHGANVLDQIWKNGVLYVLLVTHINIELYSSFAETPSVIFRVSITVSVISTY